MRFFDRQTEKSQTRSAKQTRKLVQGAWGGCGLVKCGYSRAILDEVKENEDLLTKWGVSPRAQNAAPKCAQPMQESKEGDE
jgi:hypothetical protein